MHRLTHDIWAVKRLISFTLDSSFHHSPKVRVCEIRETDHLQSTWEYASRESLVKTHRPSYSHDIDTSHALQMGRQLKPSPRLDKLNIVYLSKSGKYSPLAAFVSCLATEECEVCMRRCFIISCLLSCRSEIKHLASLVLFLSYVMKPHIK
jgi:hypothetical protein